MIKSIGALFALVLALTLPARAGEPAALRAGASPAKGTVVFVIPVREEINSPTLFTLRRGLKEAIERKADVVILDMDTPGGEGKVMLEIMEALDKFPGRKITYVNNEAISAGAIIAAVSDEIYFAPRGVMGAADVVQASGADLPETLKRKVDSYIGAKIEAYSRQDPRRASVLKAMRLPDFELKLDDKVIKSKGELLTLTADKAITLYGEPPTPLLAAGIATSLDALLATKYGGQGVEKVELKVTWSEELAQYLTAITPILMGLGMLALFIEFKTPGFGWPGTIGIILLALVFIGNYVAGLSGHEPALIFVVGILLVAAELFFFPGVVVVALAGVIFMLAALVWAGADYWPNQPMAVNFSGTMLMQPVINLALALAITVVLGALAMKYLPNTPLYRHLALQAAPAGPAQVAGMAPAAAGGLERLVGRTGLAVTGLFPSGQVEVDGRRYEAKLEMGSAPANTPVRVVGHTDFGLKVEKTQQA
ncbi:MAG TPA: NfeD family protein [Lacunisphaera sp.]|nr:NfeD family protein [Lacunisphaera sp.]